MEDSNCKGFIGKCIGKSFENNRSHQIFTSQIHSTDLAEVQSVASASPVQVGTKKIDERAFFDVSPLTYCHSNDCFENTSHSYAIPINLFVVVCS